MFALVALLLAGGVAAWIWIDQSPNPLAPRFNEAGLAQANTAPMESAPCAPANDPRSTQPAMPVVEPTSEPEPENPTTIARGEGALSGRVIDTGGSPLTSIVVVAMDAIVHRADAVTNAEGTYRFFDLAPGEYRLMVIAPNHAEVSGPGLAVVEDGRETVIETPFVLCGRVNVSMRMLDARGVPLGAHEASGRAWHVVAVFTSPGSNTTRLRALADAEGRVTFEGVPSNAFEFSLIVTGFHVPPPQATSLVEGQLNDAGDVWLSAVKEVPEFERTGSGSASGRVVDQNGDPIPDIEVFAHRVEDKSQYGSTARLDLRAMTNDSGVFYISHLEEGDWYFIVTEAEYQVIEDGGTVTVLSGGSYRLAADVVLTAPRSLKLRLLGKNGLPILEATITLVITFDEGAIERRRATTNALGVVRIARLPQGAIKLAVNAPGYRVSNEVELEILNESLTDAGDIQLTAIE